MHRDASSSAAGAPMNRLSVTAFLSSRAMLIAVLAVAFLSRAVLALQGGQYFFGDESRFNRGAALYQAVITGDWQTARLQVSAPDHTGFVYLAAALAPVQHALSATIGRADWSDPANFLRASGFGALLLGLSSTAILWLLHRIALAAGGSPLEANLAVLLGAASSALLFYSRHLLPYDASLAAALASLLLLLGGSSSARLFFSGACTASAYLLYNGYWHLVLILALAFAVTQRGEPRSRLRSALLWSAGGGVTVLLAFLPGAIFTGPLFWNVMREFSRTVHQGVFAEGWRLPWEYFWHSESVLGLAVAIALVVALGLDLRARRIPPRVTLWLSLALGGYVLLGVASAGFEKFVVYGRSARSLLPFACLLGAYALTRLIGLRSWVGAFAFVAIIVGAGINQVPHFLQAFPREVKRQVWSTLGVPKHALAFTGTTYDSPVAPVTRPELALVNTEGLFPLREFVGYPAGQVVFSTPHPNASPAYQYEGYSPSARALLRRHPVDMRLIRLAEPSRVPDLPPPEHLVQHFDLPTGYERPPR
jgi:hypothetical protein